MFASRYGISLLVFNSIDISLVGCAHSWAIEQDIRREIPYIYAHPCIILYFSFFFSRLSVCFRSELRGIIKPFMTGLTENNEFCYPKTRCFPRGQSLIASWFPMYKAFVVLKEAKEEAKRKRVTLEKFFKNTETCLYTKMNDKLRTLLEQNIGHLDDKFLLTNRVWREKNTWFSLQVVNQEYKFSVHNNSLCSQSLWVRKLT